MIYFLEMRENLANVFERMLHVVEIYNEKLVFKNISVSLSVGMNVLLASFIKKENILHSVKQDQKLLPLPIIATWIIWLSYMMGEVVA